MNHLDLVSNLDWLDEKSLPVVIVVLRWIRKQEEERKTNQARHSGAQQSRQRKEEAKE